MSNKKQLKMGAALSYVAIVINILTGMLFTPWMVAQIGQSEYGLYTLSNSVITMFLLDFGLSSATSKFVSKFRAQGDLDAVNNYLGAIYKLYLAITSVIFLCLVAFWFLIDDIYINLTQKEVEQFRIVYIISASFAVVNFPCVTFNGILNSYEKFIPLKLIDIGYRLGFVVLTTIALVQGKGLYALVIVHVLAGLLANLAKYLVVKRITPVRANLNFRVQGLYKEIFAFSAWVTISSVAQRASFNFTPTVLGMTVPNAAVAISVFGIITTIESYAYSIPGAINGMFLPRVSQIYADGDLKKLTPLMNDVGRFQFALNGLIAAGFIVVGDDFISLWMGEAYFDAYIGITLVIIPGVFYNSLQIAHTTMIVANKMYYKAIVDFGMAAINIVLSFALSSLYGVVGACWSIFAAYTFRVLALVLLYQKQLPIDIKAFVKCCFIRLSLSTLTTISIGFMLDAAMGDGGWMIFCGKVLLITAVYVSLTFLLGLNSRERNKIIRAIINSSR